MARDLSMDPGRAGVVSTPVSLAMLAVVLLPHQLLHQENALKALFMATGGFGLAALLIGAIVIHEAIHGLTWMLAGRLRPGDIAYGVMWKALMPFAHPKRPITARAYAIGGAMPGVVLGLLPSIFGLVTGRGAWSGFGAILLAAAAGDALVLWSLRGVPPATLVRDHPSRVGCETVDDADSIAVSV
jgi:hypothetical protein